MNDTVVKTGARPTQTFSVGYGLVKVSITFDMGL